MGEHVRMAVALPGSAFEPPALEPTQSLEPELRHLGMHAREAELLDARPQELQWSAHAGFRQSPRAGFCDARQVGELKALENRDQVRVIDALEPVALVEVGRLLGHPYRRRDAH